MTPVLGCLSYSCRPSFEFTSGDSSNGLGAAEIIGVSIEESREGDSSSTSLTSPNAGLCGKGDISIASIMGAGEEGSGGVVIDSIESRKKEL